LYTTFKIKSLSSWADIEISSGNSRFVFSASKVGHSSFTDLLRAIIQINKTENNSASIRFDMEAEGWLDILLLSYPNYLIKIELYHSVIWNLYDDVFSDETVPVPVFASITSIHNIAYEVTKAFEMYSRKDFENWDDSFFDKELPELKELIKQA